MRGELLVREDRLFYEICLEDKVPVNRLVRRIDAVLDLSLLRTADILQPDPSIAGGITETMRIEALCSAWQIRFATHLWGGATTFAAGLHASAAASSAFILEYSLGANPMLHELGEEDFTVIDGHIEIPDRPGLGVTINEDFVKRYKVKA